MSRILVESLNHYTTVYGLNCTRLNYIVMIHWKMQWKTLEDCFRDSHIIGAGFERAKGYCRANFNIPRGINDHGGQTMKETGLSYKCRGSHFQNNCTNLKGDNSNKFQNRHPDSKTTKDTTTHKNFMTIRTTVMCCPQEPYHSKHPNKSGQVTICL